jgi:hypothetical protein
MKASGTQTPFFGTMSDVCYKATHFLSATEFICDDEV